MFFFYWTVCLFCWLQSSAHDRADKESKFMPACACAYILFSSMEADAAARKILHS